MCQEEQGSTEAGVGCSGPGRSCTNHQLPWGAGPDLRRRNQSTWYGPVWNDVVVFHAGDGKLPMPCLLGVPGLVPDGVPRPRGLLGSAALICVS